MMTFCKKSVHSLLGLTITTTSIDAVADATPPAFSSSFDKTPYKHNGGGLGLITATGKTYRPPNVIESSVLKLLPSPPLPQPPLPPPLSFPSMFAKKDPGGIGFIDDMGGGVNGLMSCTESLGFESSDERNIDDNRMEVDTRTESPTRAKCRKDLGERREMMKKKFPPPLSSFNRKGQHSFFLRSVRADGRLELTEVRIDRPEILRASRQDGRLRLHLIREEEEKEQEEQEAELKEVEEEEEEENGKEEVEEKEEEERVEGWQFPAVSGEVLRRCNEVGMGNHRHHQNISHHHHNLHVWSQHCVPTR